MDDLILLRTFFGWCTVVHVTVMMLAFGAIVGFGEFTRGVHSRMLGLTDEQLSVAYFKFFASYKIGIWLFALGPWLALEIMV